MMEESQWSDTEVGYSAGRRSISSAHFSDRSWWRSSWLTVRYRLAFGTILVPAIITLILLSIARFLQSNGKCRGLNRGTLSFAGLHRILHRLPASGVYWRLLPVTRS